MSRIGVLILAGAWLPLVAVSLVDPTSNPIGLGLLGTTGSLVGGVLFVLGLLGSFFRAD
jgi:hypothetical protein